MLTVGASDAIANFAELLDKVAVGETVIVTRHGRVVALLGPPIFLQSNRHKALCEIKRFRKTCATGKVDIEQLIQERRLYY